MNILNNTIDKVIEEEAEPHGFYPLLDVKNNNQKKERECFEFVYFNPTGQLEYVRIEEKGIVDPEEPEFEYKLIKIADDYRLKKN